MIMLLMIILWILFMWEIGFMSITWHYYDLLHLYFIIYEDWFEPMRDCSMFFTLGGTLLLEDWLLWPLTWHVFFLGWDSTPFFGHTCGLLAQLMARFEGLLTCGSTFTYENPPHALFYYYLTHSFLYWVRRSIILLYKRVVWRKQPTVFSSVHGIIG